MVDAQALAVRTYDFPTSGSYFTKERTTGNVAIGFSRCLRHSNALYCLMNSSAAAMCSFSEAKGYGIVRRITVDTKRCDRQQPFHGPSSTLSCAGKSIAGTGHGARLAVDLPTASPSAESSGILFGWHFT
ncbi:MAG: hypothetical protein QF398_08185 [Alphaproteobacteria bacterium]|nr:hypothetical protein [Alphaproteobacteria bacterium]